MLQGSTIVAGHKGDLRTIKKLGFIDGYGGHQFIQKDMLAVTSGYFFSQEPEKGPELLRKMKDKGVAGITVKARYFDPRKLHLLVEEADELQFPIIQLADDQMQFYTLFEYFNRHIYIRKNKYFLRNDDAAAILNNSLHVGGPSALLKQLYEWTDCAAAMLMQSTCYSHPQKMEWRKFLSELDQSKIVRSAEASWLKMTDRDKSPLGIEFSYGNDEKGEIWIEKCSEQSDGNDLALLEAARAACEIGSARLIDLEHNELLLKAAFIEELVSGRLTSMNEAMLLTRQLNWRIPKKLQILLIGSPNAELSMQTVENSLLDMFKVQTQDIIACLIDSHVVVLIPEWVVERESLLKLIEDHLRANFPETKFLFGVGRSVDFRQAADSYRQARLALRVKPILTRSKRPLHFDDTGLYRLCLDAKDTSEITMLCREIIRPLLEADKESEMSLIRTLRVFFQAGSNYSRTGETLFIHPNTVRYRLNAAEKLSGLNLDNYDDSLCLQLALQLMPILFSDSGT